MAMYDSPGIRDHGTLVDMTGDFDATFAGSVAKIVTMAAVSMPVTPGGGGGGSSAPSETGGILGTSGGGSNPTTTTPTTSPGATGPAVTAPDAGGVLDATPVSGGSGGSGGGSRGGASGSTGAVAGGDGRLPFTGYAVMLTAGVGAALTGAGMALRQQLRRKSH